MDVLKEMLECLKGIRPWEWVQLAAVTAGFAAMIIGALLMA